MMAHPVPRKKPFTERERDLLLCLLKKYADIIENKRTDSVTVLRKKRTWAKITEEYNSCPFVTQESTIKQLEKAWKNLKAKARTFRLSEYCPKIHIGDTLGSEENQGDMAPHFMLSFSNPYSAPIKDVSNSWDYEKSRSEDEIDIKTNRNMEATYDNGFTDNGPQQLQNGQYSQNSRHAHSQIGDIEITAMLPESRGHDADPHQDSSQSLSRPESPDIQEIKLHSSRDDELHELNVQLVSAQLAKVKAETDLQSQILKEQLRKARAEADLAELNLEKSRVSSSDH